METYESYDAGASGCPKGFTLYKDKVIWIGYNSFYDEYFLNISNSHPVPGSAYLDSLAVFDISDIREYGATTYDSRSLSYTWSMQYGSNYEATETGTLSEIWAYVEGPSGFNEVSVKVYDYLTSGPATLLATSDSVDVTSIGWYKFTLVTPITVTSGTKYAFTAYLAYGGVSYLYYEDTTWESFYYNSGVSTYTDKPDVKYLFYADLFNTGYHSPDPPPSGIDIDEEGHIWILDEDRENLYSLDFMYDYFLVDKETRYAYFREDYSDPGVFIKPT